MVNPNGRVLLPWCSVALAALAARMVAPHRRPDGPLGRDPRGGLGLGWQGPPETPSQGPLIAGCTAPCRHDARGFRQDER